MSNFGYLANHPEYVLFSKACIEAEKVYATSPAMCAIGCRKALELAVKWVYAADRTLKEPYRDNLQSLLHEDSFIGAVDPRVWGALQFIVRLGNLAVHTERSVKASDAVASMSALFDFIDWIEYCYGSEYEEKRFSEKAIPSAHVPLDTKKIKEQQSLLNEKDETIKKLEEKIKALSEQFTAEKERDHTARDFDPMEAVTRDLLIDIDLKELGWRFEGADKDVETEFLLRDYKGIPGNIGRADYVLFGKDGLPLAVIETKRTRIDSKDGRLQAAEYSSCLERMFGRRPMIFLSNGYETYFNEQDLTGEHRVGGFFSKDSLQRLMNRRTERKNLDQIPIRDAITNRVYQKAAIRKVCDEIKNGRTRHLLVMATGSGKTRTASSCVDVLSRGNYITNVLFLADRKALVAQACDDFKNYLPNMSLCNLLKNRSDYNARIVFSTYPTILNAIDSICKNNGQRAYTPAHFDLIIIDECHRSIFRKYKAIFEYFDAQLLGLTATPRDDVDHDTYSFFDMESHVPTHVYTYEEAKEDGYLVPYYSIVTQSLFETEGITYDDLSEEDKRRFEEDFAEDEEAPPSFVPSADIDRIIFNSQTIDRVLTDLMTKGMKVAGGDRIAKTIIFAQNKRHAEKILQRFRKLYPMLGDGFAARVICDDSGSDAVISNFKQPESPSPYSLDLEKPPHIVISVDMMDTGIDVPHIGNLVFFKQVRSKTKFWQMIGRGTRKCDGMECVDFKDGSYTDKRRFFIFDYCNNFYFFKENPKGIEGKYVPTMSEELFKKRVAISKCLQQSAYVDEVYQTWRKELVATYFAQIQELHNLMPERFDIKLERKYVDKYSREDCFEIIDETKSRELSKHLAPLVAVHDDDEEAKRFDNFMYGMILLSMESGKVTNGYKKGLRRVGRGLEGIGSVPAVRNHLPLIREIQTEDFFSSNDILKFEETRQKLRSLIRLIPKSAERIIDTNLTDPVINYEEGVEVEAGYDFEDYRLKVNQYINQNRDTLVIHKLIHNQPLTEGDYKQLEKILTVDLGNKEDYQREFGDTPFGLLVRKIVKLDHTAAMEAFSGFINEENLNARQIAFVQKIIAYVEQNGYIEDMNILLRAPFDKPVSFVRLFAAGQQKKLVDAINRIRQNAEVVA